MFKETFPTQENIERKIETIKENTKIAEGILFKVVDFIRQDITTYELNQIAEQEFRKNNAMPSAKFLGSSDYISIAINEEVLFGRISKSKKIKNGDAVKIALGIFKNGYFSDLGFTAMAGEGSLASQRLAKGTALALGEAVKILKAGITVGEISAVIEKTIMEIGFPKGKSDFHNRLHAIGEIMGHGVGRNLHQPPAIPNCTGLPLVDYGFKLQKNTVVCLEPLAALGSGGITRKGKIGFITKDKKPSAHFEVPVLVKDGGVEVIGKKIFENILNQN